MASEGLNDDRSGVAAFAAAAGTIFRRMFVPPARFAEEVEAGFREEALKRWQTARNAAIALVALLWVSYFGWDYFHAFRNKDFRPALEEIVALRLVGVLCIAAAAAVLILRRHSHTAVNASLSFCLCALYTLSLAMIAVSSFPYNYLFYYICLPLILMFMFGLFRLPSRLVYALTGFCLVASFGFLLFAQTTDGSAPKSLIELMSKSMSYYNVAAVLFLASFSAIGCAVAVELERTARDAFTRERQLSDRNASLEASQRETRVKTSALVKAKDELRRLAERQNVAKSKFLADAAHDLRQPMQALTNLLGAARHALDKGDGVRCDEILTLAQDASRLTRNSFNAVLDISRLESGFVEAELADFDLPALIEEVAAPCLAVAEERGVEVRLRWRKDPPIAVRSDRHLLGRVIGNLLSNAIKYSDPAKKGSTVILGVVCLPSRVRIDIVDNGVGIGEADWARVFSPFVQLHNDERDRDKGVGLGLSIVNAIIPLLPEHRLDMRSSEGQGTRFSLELPYGIAAAQVAGPAVASASHGAGDLSGLYVVYVEDDSLVRRSTQALFDMLEIRYEAYGSYAELEAGLPTLERDPDLLITDYRLPDARTAQDVVRLTSWTFERALPLIVVTGEMTQFDAGSWLAGGKILRKPVAPEALTAEIAAACLAATAAE